MTRRLIVNADDYGLTDCVSAGIRSAHRQGIVTSTTVMCNMPASETQVPLALAECPDLGLGVHLVLTAGQPLRPPEDIASVITLAADGRSFPRLPELLAGIDRVDPAEVLAEWRAQVERFMQMAGRAPTHLDSHHHTSFLSPDLLEGMLTLARELGCAIRTPLVAPEIAHHMLGLPPSSDLVERLARFLPAVMAANPDVPRPDHFEVRFFGAQATAETLRLVLGSLPEGTTELMCHPGRLDSRLSQTTSYYQYRPVEAEVLSQPHLRDWLGSLGVELIHFGALGRGPSRS
jgi:predicted glycoside hydrolase/deacetylase ChbG (UPF0249 family)